MSLKMPGKTIIRMTVLAIIAVCLSLFPALAINNAWIPVYSSQAKAIVALSTLSSILFIALLAYIAQYQNSTLSSLSSILAIALLAYIVQHQNSNQKFNQSSNQEINAPPRKHVTKLKIIIIGVVISILLLIGYNFFLVSSISSIYENLVCNNKVNRSTAVSCQQKDNFRREKIFEYFGTIDDISSINSQDILDKTDWRQIPNNNGIWLMLLLASTFVVAGGTFFIIVTSLVFNNYL